MYKERIYIQTIENMLRCGEGKLCEDCRSSAIQLISENQEELERIDIDIEEKTFTCLALEAHKRDITLNELFEEIILEYGSKKNDE